VGERIRIQDSASGTDVYLAPAHRSPGAPILLLHSWWGLNADLRNLADRLAADGFTVMAPDLFDGTVLTTIEDAEAFTGAIEKGDGGPGGLNPDRIMQRVAASLSNLVAHPDARGNRAGIVALSFGGWYGSEVAAGRSDVAAFVSIYSDVYEGPGGSAYLGHFAEDDQFVETPEAAGVDTPLPRGSASHIYPGMKHWFTEPDRPEYDAQAPELVYARTVEFLRANLG
jgi:carboxymethylenebutenolidase